MTNNYQTMIDRIADEIQDSNITTQIQRAIQDAISLYEPTRFYFNQTQTTFSTVAAQEYYTGTDLADIPLLIEIDSLLATISGVKVPCQAQDFRQMDDAQSGIYVGPPRAFAYYNEQIRLYPIPDAVYVMPIAYHHRLTTLSAGSDTNAWMQDAEILIRQQAKILLALDVLQEPNLATNAAPLRDMALARLEKETRKRRSNPRLKTDIPTKWHGGNVRSGEMW